MQICICNSSKCCLQLFFVDETGKARFTSKADVWSALLTLIYVLLGKNEKVDPLGKVHSYIHEKATNRSHNYTLRGK